jgi:predicted nucleic acid-binding protein
MSGKELLVDTNIIIYLLQKDDTLAGLLQGKQLFISFITELELLGFPSLTAKQENQIETLLNDCIIVSLNNNIKSSYKAVCKSYKLKLGDSIIAATAMSLDIPLMTADKQFKAIKVLELVQYEK